ncbi:hypothetical protein [Brevibacillus thermoruber]|uniref:hypothetical protein n=1 Tax=Brevibacillus thermoruber TaxID=33942 RepID=UPI00048CEBEC|nr:hypothetical protein [Brevibacillus thermoruber]
MDITNVLRAHGIGVGKKLVGDAQPSDVRAGKTFSNADGNDKVGTLPVRATSAQTITPGTTNQVLQAGIYDGAITVLGDPDLVASNIRSGINIFGVVGNVIEGKRWGTGNIGTLAPQSSQTISGLSFIPKTIIISYHTSSSTSASTLRSDYACLISSNGYSTWSSAEGFGLAIVSTQPTGTSFTINNPSSTATAYYVNWLAYE